MVAPLISTSHREELDGQDKLLLDQAAASRFKRLDVGDVGHNTLLCWQLVGTMPNCPIA